MCSASVARIAGSARANSIMCSYFVLSRTSRNCGWYWYCLRPLASRPVAWIWPLALGQIHTSVQAGGMASLRMRSSVAASLTGSPSAFR